MTNPGIPLYVAQDDNKSFLVINDKKYALEMCPTDLLPFMDSAILVYDNEDKYTSYICKSDLSSEVEGSF